MKNIINKVKALAHSHNVNQQKISHFIIDLHFDLAQYSATKMGAQLGISDSSIIRYAKSLGCSGFPDLKLQLAAQSQHVSPRHNQSVYDDIQSSDSTRDILAKSQYLFTSKIEQSLSLIEADTIEHCAELLVHADKIVLSGIGSSALVASDINHKLIRSGCNVHFNPDYHTQIIQASLLKCNDVLFVISARGNTQEVLTAIDKAREAKAKVIALTQYGEGKVAQQADYVIPYSYTEEHSQLGMVTPQLLQMIAFDVLFFKLNTMTDSANMHKALSSIRTIQQ